jgi:hypothetical protein
MAARNFKTVTLELGGKSPNIVFDDADLDQAVKGAVSGIFAAAGQSCQAGSRLLLQRGIHDRFVDKLVGFMRDVKLGDPSSPTPRSARSRRDRSSRRCSPISRSPVRRVRPASSAAAAAPTSAPAVRRADHLHRRPQPHADRPGRGLRAGALQ